MPLTQDDLIELDPEALSALDGESDFMKRTKRTAYMPRLALPREKGERVLTRLLPVSFGTNGSWFGRVAQHWIGKGGKPVVCIKNTGVPLGGNPDHQCPVCAVVEEGESHSSQAVQGRAAECFGEAKWICVGLHSAKDDGRSRRPVPTPEPGCYVPHEIGLFRYQFEQVKEIYAGSLRKLNDPSHPKYDANKGYAVIDFLDIQHGRDLWITKGPRGLEFKAQDSSSALAAPERLQEVVADIWSKIIMPTYSIPDADTEAEYAAKAREYIFNNRAPANDGGRRGAGTDNLDDLPTEPPSTEVDPAPQPTRPAAPPVSRPTAPPVSRPATPQTAPAPAARATPQPTRPAAPPVAPPPRIAPPTPPPQRTPQGAPRANTLPPPAVLPPPRVIPPAAPAAVDGDGDGDDDADNTVAPESHDPAPPIAPEAPLDVLPPVSAAGSTATLSAPRTSLRERLEAQRRALAN